MLKDQLKALEQEVQAALDAATDDVALEGIRLRFLGRSGEITNVRKSIGTLAPAERPEAGKAINTAAAALEARIEAARHGLALKQLHERLAERIDVTFPALPARMGSLHPIRRALEDACGYLQRLGFAVVLGNEVETERYNFDALNIPADHPAREGLDSFYLRPGVLLRTHTSPMQVRTMEAVPPPLAVVVPGKAYRRDAIDARHSPMFHQIEGLLVAPGIHLGHLKGTLTGLLRELFGASQAVRFRPSFFPFTEPSAEVDTTCPGCGGSGCKTCGGSGWIEVGGAGMVHPDVLRNAGYDPTAVQGWAFGIGIDRIVMVRHDVDDIRVLFENDPRVLATLR
ncbi:MAG: phenylalanine--tRNA ligase subunit alpha [Candidatus Eremiobacteraeota bacterium]|nr:phenylalanine--tRNA ligase subunit alpha [Candidatus Eremiobacteraeota bacterium]MBC5801822.1 phenylalanine--tRNA ligase subunit alpha [Candidatus Eremiobacteraeota bacterium]